MKRRPGLLVALVIASAITGACGSGTEGDPPPSSPSTPASSLVAPGSQSPGADWRPSIPDRPVDDIAIEQQYAQVLADAGTAIFSVEEPNGGSVGRRTVSTEQYDDVCVVKVEQPVTVSSISDPDPLKQALSAAVAPHGFADLDFANDPGGAIRFIAHDSRGALFEFRSKADTTVAVRVATADSACSG